jgi:hypothetical protein
LACAALWGRHCGLSVTPAWAEAVATAWAAAPPAAETWELAAATGGG